VRGAHAHVAGGKFSFLGQLLQLLHDGRALGQPQGQAGAGVFGVHRVQAHLGAQLAVVAPLGLLQHGEVRLQLRLVLEGGAVDALELGLVGIAAVVGAGQVGQLEGLDASGAENVRAAAQVDKFAILVEGDGLALGNVGQALDLVALAHVLDDAGGLFARDLGALELLVLGHDFAHLGLDFHEVLGGQAVLQVEVVVETVVGGRTDVELDLGTEKPAYRRSP
jgi:hypothetical protein